MPVIGIVVERVPGVAAARHLPAPLPAPPWSDIM
jgi:hypothetical protein